MLYQFFSLPKPMTTASGILVTSTEESIKEEMAQTWADIRGAKGEAMRSRLVVLSEKVLESRKSGGARKALEGIVALA
jgi:hypothetical protein